MFESSRMSWMIPNDASTVVRVKAEAAHKLKLEDFANYETAERGCSKFLPDVVDEVWYNELKDADTFYTQVPALDIIGASTRWTVTCISTTCRSPEFLLWTGHRTSGSQSTPKPLIM